MAGAVVEVEQLTKRYGPVLAVDDLSFTVGAGTICGFLGPNGAGKTTTLRCLLGLAAPSAGSVTINGKPYRELPRPAETVGALLETAGFHPGRSGRNHLRHIARTAGLPMSHVDSVLELVGLAGERGRRRAGKYSMGMRQRLALASALLADPQVLILDEPTNGMDPEGIRWLRELLREKAARGRTVIVSSHLLSEVALTVDEVAILNQGRLVLHTTMEDLRGSAPAGVRVRSRDSERLAEVLTSRAWSVRRDGGDELFVSGASPEEIGDLAAGHGIPLVELAATRDSLEDVFLRIVQGQDDGRLEVAR